MKSAVRIVSATLLVFGILFALVAASDEMDEGDDDAAAGFFVMALGAAVAIGGIVVGVARETNPGSKSVQWDEPVENRRNAKFEEMRVRCSSSDEGPAPDYRTFLRDLRRIDPKGAAMTWNVHHELRGEGPGVRGMATVLRRFDWYPMEGDMLFDRLVSKRNYLERFHARAFDDHTEFRLDHGRIWFRGPTSIIARLRKAGYGEETVEAPAER